MTLVRISYEVGMGGWRYGTNAGPHPKATIREAGGPYILTLPFAPNEVAQEDIGINWVEASRPGMTPLLLPSDLKLQKTSFELILTGMYNKGLSSAEQEIDVLKSMATRGLDLIVALGPSVAPFLWKITNLSFQTVRREFMTNYVAVARAQVELTQSSPLTNAIVPGMQLVIDRLPPISPPSKRASSSSSSSKSSRTTNAQPQHSQQALNRDAVRV